MVFEERLFRRTVSLAIQSVRAAMDNEPKRQEPDIPPPVPQIEPDRGVPEIPPDKDTPGKKGPVRATTA